MTGQSLSSCPQRIALSRFLSGRLSNETIESIGLHLDSCVVCQQLIEELDQEINSSREDSVLPYWSSAGQHSQSVTDFSRLRAKLRHLQNGPREKVDTASSQDHPTEFLSYDLAIPRRLGPYELQDRIGQGAMGVVFKVWHVRLKRTMAVKLLLPKYGNDPLLRARFDREMEAIGKLENHPHIVQASNADEENGIHFIVMDYIAGCDLSSLLVRVGKLRISDACEMARQAALGLHHAHGYGILHRDVKPSNLMLAESGQVKILDLGLALFQEELSDGEPNDDYLVGTADYIAPEIWSGSAPLGVESDVYSLGCTLFKLLTGHAPYSESGKGSKRKRRAHIKERIPSASAERPTVPDKLDSLLSRMLAKKPAERFADLGEVVQALEQFTADADLASLAAKVHNENSVTQPLAADRTMLTRLANTSKQARSLAKPLVGHVLLAILVLGGIASHDFSSKPTYQPEVLLSLDSQRIMWDYDPSIDTVHLQSKNFSMVSTGNNKNSSGILRSKIKLTMGRAAAGVFFGHYIIENDKIPGHHFEMVGVRPHTTGASYELYWATVTVQSFNGRTLSWKLAEQAVVKLPLDLSVETVDLALHFEGGLLASVKCNSTNVDLLPATQQSSLHSMTITGTYGVYTSGGATKFQGTHFTHK